MVQDIRSKLLVHGKCNPERNALNVNDVESILNEDKHITHVALVHCATTTGILNPIESLCKVIKKYSKTLIVDALSSFGGINIDIENLGIDYLISSNDFYTFLKKKGFVIYPEKLSYADTFRIGNI